MDDTAELRARIRAVLEEAIPSDPAAVEQALGRIMDEPDPFGRAAQLELERFRTAFVELAR